MVSARARPIHALCGTARSGSTLLANLLNQNPRIKVSDTSPLGPGFHAGLNGLTHRREFQSELAKGPSAERRLDDAMRGMITGWYAEDAEPVVIDKDRSNTWLFHHDSFRSLFPTATLIVLVRHPLDILASILKRQQEVPLIRMQTGAGDRTAAAVAAREFGPGGVVGSAMVAIENLIQLANLPGCVIGHVMFIRYEDFAGEPQKWTDDIHTRLGEAEYAYDVERVENVAQDRDELYLGLFRHEGHGPIVRRPSVWREYVPLAVAAATMARFPLYNQTFGYGADQ